MGKGSDTSATTAAETSDASALTALAAQQGNNAQKLFGASFPGFVSAENFNQTLASGDPYAIARAVAPASQQIDQASAQAKANILQNGPAGGEKNLALEQVDVNRGAEVGKTASSGYLNSFNALASLSGQGISQAGSQAGSAISGYNSAVSGLNALNQQSVEQKGAQLGAISGLAGDAATLGGAGIAAYAAQGATS